MIDGLLRTMAGTSSWAEEQIKEACGFAQWQLFGECDPELSDDVVGAWRVANKGYSPKVVLAFGRKYLGWDQKYINKIAAVLVKITDGR
ncbi:hypothetical protein COY23_01790 [bacterium (Candidatus Torokbacteria) CG_4_10_14_0_2_um_filter_35_8]|nr:MAG: hypothetical protein COY23_01790 [bacterium (Candidatus Torokbacteria) CG_4_10_14_0_2_um_filter_35_8]